MIPVDESYVIEEVSVPESELIDDEAGVKLRRNSVEPELIVDGVDVYSVIENPDQTYQIDYWGYVSGRVVVEPAGVEALGQKLLGDDQNVPHWIIDPDTADPDSLPSWLPPEAEVKPTEVCELCTSERLARRLYIPNTDLPGSDVDIICHTCWNRRVPYYSSKISTMDAIQDDTRIDIYAKIESQSSLDTGGELYTVRDLAGNAFDLKLWASKADRYELAVGTWYRLEDAKGDTYDAPMIDSNHGDLSADAIKTLDPSVLRSRGRQLTRDHIEDGAELDILARVERITEFDNGDIRCALTDREGQDFDLKIWADEADQYDLKADQWYYFVRAKGDTYDDPMIDSNNGALVDIPIEDVDTKTTYI